MDRQVIIHQHILQTHLPDACKLLMGKITEFVDCNIVNINKKEITDFFNWNIHKVNKCLQKLEKENIIEIIDNKTIKLFYYHRYLPEFQFLHLDDVSVLRKIYNDLEDDDNIYTNLYCGNVITKSLLALNLNDGNMPRIHIDRIEREGLNFHKRVRKAFLKLAEEESERIILIDARKPIDEIASLIRNHTLALLNKKTTDS